MPPQLFGQVPGFEAKAFVANRKGLKVMSRDAQLGIAASVLACRDAGISAGGIDPERLGVVLGADQICAPIDESKDTYAACMRRWPLRLSAAGSATACAASYPLGLLRVLPNMIASHVSIAHDARGPNNTIHEGEISSLLAVIEAASVIQRGMADVMIAGGASSQMHPLDLRRRWAMGGISRRGTKIRPAPCGPSTPHRDGHVWSEGAAAVLLESRRSAEARGAKIHARLKGWGAAFEPVDAQPPAFRQRPAAGDRVGGPARRQFGGQPGARQGPRAEHRSRRRGWRPVCWPRFLPADACHGAEGAIGQCRRSGSGDGVGGGGAGHASRAACPACQATSVPIRPVRCP